MGIDFGTSGCRISLITATGAECGSAATPFSNSGQNPALWRHTLHQLIGSLAHQHDLSELRAIAVDGTSGTVVGIETDGSPVTEVLFYSDQRAVHEATRIGAIAPPESGAHGAGSGLAKILWLRHHNAHPIVRFQSQAGWVSGWLSDHYGVEDSNNCLKWGYDPIKQQWPAWLMGLGLTPSQLPLVVNAGTIIGPIAPTLAQRWGVPTTVQISAPTTDSTAGVMAAGAAQPGDGVTILGSTLVVKVVSERPLFSAPHGIYSQPYGNHWLVGGASNSGGAVLAHFFTPAELQRLSQQIAPTQPSPLDYYPLLQAGERFPINDAKLAPRITPRPDNAATFLHGLLEGMARIEAQGYALLAALGAPLATTIRTVGGGSQNPVWHAIRQRRLNIPLIEATHQQAAYGAALLARHSNPVQLHPSANTRQDSP